jgi:hypothetical protein
VSPIRRARDEAVAFEPVCVLRQSRCRDALARGEVAEPDARRILDRDEQRDLLGGDALRARLAPELAPDPQQHGPQGVCDLDRVDGDWRRHIVNLVNDSKKGGYLGMA